MDENVLRISRSWNRVDPEGYVRVKALPGRTEPGGEAWGHLGRSMGASLAIPFHPFRAWMRVDDGFVQHQQPFCCEIPVDLPVEPDLTPNWEEELPARPVPR
eukprot:6021463-Amphidinium_carterae.1